MKKNRKNTLPVLIDIRYKWSMNRFEEFYRDSVKYKDIEQESYIELKTMTFEFINKNIKFRKFDRENGTLTLKANMLESELEKFNSILNGEVLDEEKTEREGEEVYKRFFFMHDFEISNVRIHSPEDDEKAKNNKKAISEDDEDDEGDVYEKMEREDSDFSEDEDYL
jgi:hypothetical protein